MIEQCNMERIFTQMRKISKKNYDTVCNLENRTARVDEYGTEYNFSTR